MLSGFAPGDIVDLASIAFESSGTATLSGTTLTVVESGQTYALQFDSTVSGDIFKLVTDGEVARPTFRRRLRDGDRARRGLTGRAL